MDSIIAPSKLEITVIWAFTPIQITIITSRCKVQMTLTLQEKTS